MAFAREDLRRELYRLGKVAGDLGQCGKKEISEAVPAEVADAAEPMPETTSTTRCESSDKRDHAVADIAGRQHLQFVAKPARASAVVRDRDDRGQMFDPDRVQSTCMPTCCFRPESSVDRPFPPPIATQCKPL